MSFEITMSLDTKSYNRSVYSILDFLGDVGGLFSILLPIGGIFVALLDEILNRTLESYIIKKVFFNLRKSKKPEQNLSGSKLNHLRKQFTADLEQSM